MLKDGSLTERAGEMTLFIAEHVYRYKNEIVDHLQFDLTIDGSGFFHLIKLENVAYIIKKASIPSLERSGKRRSTIRLAQLDSEDEDEYCELPIDGSPMSKYSDKDTKKSKEMLKNRFDLKFHRIENSSTFVEMIAKTIEKRKNKQLNRARLDIKKKSETEKDA